MTGNLLATRISVYDSKERLLRIQQSNPQFTASQLEELDELYGVEQVDAMTHLPFVCFQLLFSGSIPADLQELLEHLQQNQEIDPARLNEWQSASDICYLYQSFLHRFHRLPQQQLFYEMISSMEVLQVKHVADHFHVKSMRYCLSLQEEIGGSIFHPMYLGLAFGSRAKCIVEKLKKHNTDIYGFISGMPLSVPILDKQLLAWIEAHAGSTSTERIHEICRSWNQPFFPKNGTTKEMLNFLSKNQAEEEWQRCAHKYPEVFAKPFRCSIQNHPYTTGDERVRMLDPNDHLQVLLGALTVCCQQLNHTGEASMIEGLLNPDSGFLIFERKEKILAQAWVWLSADKSQLVLDNIELADNRKEHEILHLLYHWVENSPYDNIAMGCDFNKVGIGIPMEAHEKKWYRKHWKYEYTDAKNRVWLKKNKQNLIRSEQHVSI